MRLFLLFQLFWLFILQLKEIYSVRCKIDVRGFDMVDLRKREIFTRPGHIRVNGVPVLDFIDFMPYPDLYPETEANGIWLVALTPACEVIDISLFDPGEKDAKFIYQSYPYFAGEHFDSYIESLPYGSIIIGASSKDAHEVFEIDPANCGPDASSDYGFCFNRRNRYMLVALGLDFSFVYEEPTQRRVKRNGGSMDYDFIAGFVTQKGFPRKAQWIIRDRIFQDVEFETTIFTPDHMVDAPLQPIQDYLGSTLPVDKAVVIVQPFNTEGTITAWRFYAKNAANVVFYLVRTDSNDMQIVGYNNVSSSEITEDSVNYFIVPPSERLYAKVGDFIAVSNDIDYTTTQSTIPTIDRTEFDRHLWPNCDQTSGIGLTEASLVPLHYFDDELFNNVDIDSDDLIRFTQDLYYIWTSDETIFHSVGAVAVEPIMIPGFYYNGDCDTTATCKAWDINSVCKYDRCACATNFEFVYELGKCMRYIVTDTTCDLTLYMDRPYLGRDLPHTMKIHGMYIGHESPTAVLQTTTLPVTLSNVIEEATMNYYIDYIDLGSIFYHPPCVTITLGPGSNNDFSFIVQDVTRLGFLITIIQEADLWCPGDMDTFSYTAIEMIMYNLRLAIGYYDEDTPVEPQKYEVCTSWTTNFMGGPEFLMCDEPIEGNRILLYQPGDGFVGRDDGYMEPLRELRRIGVCVVKIYVSEDRKAGAICENDEYCGIWYLECISNRCECIEGFMEEPITCICVDVNECLDDNGGCSDTCVNTIGSYYCECPKYYELRPNKHDCYHINECSTGGYKTSPCQHICDNTIFPYRCFCYNGYELSNDRHTCLDVDECKLDDDICDNVNGGCYNTYGNYTCYCNEGYELMDNKLCIDINECLHNNGGCEQDCHNTQGSYKCLCHPPNYLALNKHDCIEVDPICSLDELGCDRLHGSCVKTEDGLQCGCVDGYQIIPFNNQCRDANECEDKNGGCEQICVNSIGSFHCDCMEGFTLSLNTFSCIDINECQMDLPDCLDCINTHGSYRCSCATGYQTSHEGECTDINECESGASLCQQMCTNTDGSYICSCKDGYSPVGYACEDVNECLFYNGGCNGDCINTPGSFHCDCTEDEISLGMGLGCAPEPSDFTLRLVLIGTFKKDYLDNFHPNTVVLTELIGQMLSVSFPPGVGISFFTLRPGSIIVDIALYIDDQVDVSLFGDLIYELIVAQEDFVQEFIAMKLLTNVNRTLLTYVNPENADKVIWRPHIACDDTWICGKSKACITYDGDPVCRCNMEDGIVYCSGRPGEDVLILPISLAAAGVAIGIIFLIGAVWRFCGKPKKLQRPVQNVCPDRRLDKSYIVVSRAPKYMYHEW